MVMQGTDGICSISPLSLEVRMPDQYISSDRLNTPGRSVWGQMHLEGDMRWRFSLHLRSRVVLISCLAGRCLRRFTVWTVASSVSAVAETVPVEPAGLTPRFNNAGEWINNFRPSFPRLAMIQDFYVPVPSKEPDVPVPWHPPWKGRRHSL